MVLFNIKTMRIKHFYLPALLISICTYSAIAQKSSSKQTADKNSSDWFIKPVFKKGEMLGNIYSRAIAYSGDDFKDLVQRVSGSSTYKVLDDDYLKPVFNETDVYDGRPATNTTITVEPSGKVSFNNQTMMNSSASGLMYSELVWGKLPAKIHEGDSWKINIGQPWELGGPGEQTVTVMQVDAAHHTIMLKREGSSEGYYDYDAKQISITTKDGKSVKMDMAPGTSHWIGYTIFKNGIVISDELLVTRPITLTAEGLKFDGKEREYILLNAMPVDDKQ